MLDVVRALPAEDLRLLVFDLDGTLIDSRRDLCEAVNAMLARLARPALPESVIAGYIGDGAGMLVRRALGDPVDEAFVEHALALFLNYYREHNLDHTYVYDGVMQALDVLSRRVDGSAQAMAVLTNKPVGASREICSALGLSRYFFAVYGGNSFATKKPDPAGLRQLMDEAQAAPAQTLVVGDSEVDVLTARAMEAWSMGCRYGLSPQTIDAMREQNLVDVVVDHPLEWLTALGAGVAPKETA